MAGPMPPVPNVLQVQIQGTIPGEIWENVLHFGYVGPPPDVSNTTTFAQAIAANFNVHVGPLISANVTMSQVVVTDMGSTTGAEGVGILNAVGGRGAGEVPANSAVLISYPSPSRFRGGHFRTYLLAGINSDLQNPMTWTTAFTALVNTNWQAFISTTIGITVAGAQITSLIGLRRHGKFLPNMGPPNYVLTTPVQLTLSAQNIIVHQQVASQKGRIGRRSK